MDLESLIPDAADLRELEGHAIAVARACGRLIVGERPTDLGVDATKSSSVDIVTVMDRRSERLAADELRARRPHDGQYGEEGLRHDGSGPVTWVVDPIDGTVNYLYDIPAYAVSVAAVVGDPGTDGGWLPVAGAVFNPAADELFSAFRGGGARLQHGNSSRALHFSPARSLEQSLVATGFSYAATIRAQQGASVARLLPRARDIRRIGSAALDLCHVASGSVDAYYERLLNPWDMAAGWLVCTEAGATVRGLAGSGPGRDWTFAGGAAILDELESIVA